METVPDTATDRPRRSWFGRLWRVVQTTLIVLFVCWHLFFMFVRNHLDLWEDTILGWAKEQTWWSRVERPVHHIDYKTWYYGNFTGCEQGWGMFSPPMARRVAFMGGKLIFSDGSHAIVTSINEPQDPASYFRAGGWRQRKLEDCLGWVKPESIPESADLPVYGAFIRWYIRTWRQAHPDDPRTVSEVHLIYRNYVLPGVDQDPASFAPPTESVLAVFSPEGEYLQREPDTQEARP